MSRQTPVSVGSVMIGADLPPLFLPDIDVYFKQDISIARKLVRDLKRYGVTTLKGAVLHDPEICLPVGDANYYVKGEGLRQENYRQIIERHVVPLEDLRSIYSGARDIGLDLVLSIYDEPGLELALEMEAAAIKIPSSNITHVHLIRTAAAIGLPLILDTGRSSMEEIARAINWARQAGASALIVEHSPPGPPAAPDEFNLRMMVALGENHSCFDGLSDHLPGIELMLAATALGADVLEKGVCLDDTLPDIDIAHALPISEVPALLEKVALVHAALGKKERVLPSDRSLPPDRMGIIAKNDIEMGTPLSIHNVQFAFPALGIPAEAWDEVQGKSLVRRIAAGELIRPDDVKNNG